MYMFCFLGGFGSFSGILKIFQFQQINALNDNVCICYLGVMFLAVVYIIKQKCEFYSNMYPLNSKIRKT